MSNLSGAYRRYSWLYDLLFLLVILLAGYLRLTGVDWGEGQHQHPDENFLSGVAGSLQAHKCTDPTIPAEICPTDQKRWMTIAEYFDNDTSTLNPYNRGYSFFVYGNLPMTLVRVAAEATNQLDVKMIGRQFSALADLFTIVILYFIVTRLYDRRTALLASLFSALTVMQIQQSHFFTTDLFVNPFAFLAIYFAVLIVQYEEKRPETKDTSDESSPQSSNPPTINPSVTNYQLPTSTLKSLLSTPLIFYSLGFGIAYGMALASKVNIYPLAILLPGAFAVRYLIMLRESKASVEDDTSAIEGDVLNEASLPTNHQSPITKYLSLITDHWQLILACLIAGGLAAFISFRIFQPYAFDGILPGEQWVANIQEQRIQAKGDSDVPWSLQWARRTHLYSFTNLTVWGLGLPLGILAWAGFLYMGWRILKGEWKHALLWGWTALYFAWQSMQFNPTMRYQLPIYPLLVMMAAWFVFERLPITNYKLSTAYSVLRTIITIIVIALTAAWAFAFHSIYLRDEPRMAASRWIFQNAPAAVNIQIKTTDGSTYNQPLPFPTGITIEPNVPYNLAFTPSKSGIITGFTFPYLGNKTTDSTVDVSLILSEQPNPTPDLIITQASAVVVTQPAPDQRGVPVTITFDQPIPAEVGRTLWLTIQTSNGIFTFSGSALVNETDYDYGLPFRVDGYDPFGGIYRGDLNLQVYWDDNADKLTRYVNILDQADYILIPTNHQYAQITRLPERYPLTTLYYRELMGCPLEMEIIPCYHEAQPGDHQGRLGFDLVAVFETFPALDLPKLGRIEINDQYAEEAFTFYDHPKVLIFKKNASFSAQQVQSTLSTVDLTKVARLAPKQFADYKSLLLTPEQLVRQRAGGTWSELFDYDWVQNRYPMVGLLLWYAFIFVLGLITYPIIRLAMPGLADKGYPLSRALGLIIFGYLVWLPGSVGVAVTRVMIGVVFGVLFISGVAAGRLQRDELIDEWKTRRKYFLMAEGLFLGFFLIDFLLRLGNPDLWHPSFGGERPMDFSYFNAVIKSTTFPPYDPWYAGGYINYYYYGFVLVGMPVKLLGIVPSIAYNFILPTLFAMVGMGAFSIGWNLLQKDEDGRMKDENLLASDSSFAIHPSSFIAGLAASALTILLGNLGTLQTVYNKLQQLGAMGAFTWTNTLTQRLTWAFQGLKLLREGVTLPMSPGEWYWLPSRVVPPGPDNSITEFPLFTFIYSDLHAHMMVMPIALLALAWALSVLKTGSLWKNQAHPASDRRLSIILSLLIGGVVIGAAYPANLSDAYTYLLIGMIALTYAIWQYADVPDLLKRSAWMIGGAAVLYVLSKYMYLPYREWYAQAYSALDPWKGPFTPLMSYFTQWLVFLFIIVSWLAWETREWMANTPLSALKKLKPYQVLIEGGLIGLVVLILAVQYIGSSVGWIALPIAAWAAVMLLNPRMNDAQRFVLFLIGTALFITVLVEVVVVRGDIGRQNTIFKFYMQAWLMFAVSAGAALAWTLPGFFKWLPGWRAFWQAAMTLLIAGAALFTITGISGKVRDRWIVEAPRTLDAMTFMNYAKYDDFGQRLDLSEDYRAIRWMQDNVQGSPVIVEANCVEYHWCTRFTIYTGLPGVVGWNWHQRQQRAYNSLQVEERVASVGSFYNNVDIEATLAFLKLHNVKYIVVGQVERAAYTELGLLKFDQFDGEFWRSVYADGRTTIYEVIP